MHRVEVFDCLFHIRICMQRNVSREAAASTNLFTMMLQRFELCPNDMSSPQGSASKILRQGTFNEANMLIFVTGV